LQRTLAASAAAAGCPVRVAAAGEAPWSSATFVGARHAITLEAEPSAAWAAWVDDLARGSLTIAGHVVAEMKVERRTSGVAVEVLTLEA
jgi:hypothetical protein